MPPIQLTLQIVTPLSTCVIQVPPSQAIAETLQNLQTRIPPHATITIPSIKKLITEWKDQSITWKQIGLGIEPSEHEEKRRNTGMGNKKVNRDQSSAQTREKVRIQWEIGNEEKSRDDSAANKTTATNVAASGPKDESKAGEDLPMSGVLGADDKELENSGQIPSESQPVILPPILSKEEVIQQTNPDGLLPINHTPCAIEISTDHNSSSKTDIGKTHRPFFIEIPEVHSKKKAEPVPDSFYELSRHDMATLIGSARQTIEGKPLLTQALRDSIEAEKIRQRIEAFPKTRIIISGPGCLLTTEFETLEKVDELYKFLSQKLAHDAAFQLSLPPRQDVEPMRNQTFLKAGLCPNSKVYFTWKDRSLGDFLLPSLYIESNMLPPTPLAPAQSELGELTEEHKKEDKPIKKLVPGKIPKWLVKK